jgi:hypothetical protein
MGLSELFPAKYNNVLFFNVEQLGLRMSLFLPFRLFSPPLFIPWAEVDSVVEKQLWLQKCVVISVLSTSVKLTVFGKAGDSIAKAYAYQSGARLL